MKPAPQKYRTTNWKTCNQVGNLRLPTHGGLYAWRFQGGQGTAGASLGPVDFQYDASDPSGGTVAPDVTARTLQRVLDDWCPTLPGYRLYYPSRRQASPAFALVVEALRQQAQVK
jgi:DNA-binding transcriptional LysR family regulator